MEREDVQHLVSFGSQTPLLVDRTQRFDSPRACARALFAKSGEYHVHDGRAYDIAPDGERFLMIKANEEANRELNVVLNWFDELKRLVPTH